MWLFQMFFHFILQCQKNISVNITVIFTRKVFKYWEAVKFMMMDTKF